AKRRGDQMLVPALGDARLMREQRAEILICNPARREGHQQRRQGSAPNDRPTASHACTTSAHTTPRQARVRPPNGRPTRLWLSPINLAKRLRAAATASRTSLTRSQSGSDNLGQIVETGPSS